MICFALGQRFERESLSVIAAQGHELERLTTSESRRDGVSATAIPALKKLSSKY
jgi:hypothetical protein